jgi:LPXTG-motif cell wall-anchored protein
MVEVHAETSRLGKPNGRPGRHEPKEDLVKTKKVGIRVQVIDGFRGLRNRWAVRSSTALEAPDSTWAHWPRSSGVRHDDTLRGFSVSTTKMQGGIDPLDPMVANRRAGSQTRNRPWFSEEAVSMKSMSRAGLMQKTIRRSARLATATAVGGVVMLGFSGAAHAGNASVTADCDTATVSWRADGGLAEVDWMYVLVIGSDGTSVRSGPAGSLPAEFDTTYKIEYWANPDFDEWAEDVLWGENTVTTPARDLGCDEPTPEVPVAPEPPATPNAPVTPEVVAPPVESAGPVVEAPPIAPEVLSSGLTAQAAGPELPATGRNTDLLLLAGTLTAAAGVSLLIIRRRSDAIAVD